MVMLYYITRRPTPLGILMRWTLLQSRGRDALAGDFRPSSWMSASVSSRRSSEACFSDMWGL
jgi:hypothetical protein